MCVFGGRKRSEMDCGFQVNKRRKFRNCFQNGFLAKKANVRLESRSKRGVRKEINGTFYRYLGAKRSALASRPRKAYKCTKCTNVHDTSTLRQMYICVCIARYVDIYFGGGLRGAQMLLWRSAV